MGHPYRTVCFIYAGRPLRLPCRYDSDILLNLEIIDLFNDRVSIDRCKEVWRRAFESNGEILTRRCTPIQLSDVHKRIRPVLRQLHFKPCFFTRLIIQNILQSSAFHPPNTCGKAFQSSHRILFQFARCVWLKLPEHYHLHTEFSDKFNMSDLLLELIGLLIQLNKSFSSPSSLAIRKNCSSLHHRYKLFPGSITL